MFRATSLEKINYSLVPDPTAPDVWTSAKPCPEYRIHYRYSWWGDRRYIQATVYQCTWYGDRRISCTYSVTAKAAYRAAHRAVRTFEKYGTVNYTPANLAVHKHHRRVSDAVGLR